MNIIIVDGGNRGGTYASFMIFDSKGNRIVHKSIYWGIGDHNLAEYLGVLAALQKALTMDIKSVIIFTDSETVAQQVLFERPLHAEKLKKIRDEILERLKEFKHWEIQHVSRVLIKSFLGH